MAEDPFFFDKWFCQLTGYRYINMNEYQPGQEEELAEILEVGGLLAPEPCSCIVSEEGKKCEGLDCPLRRHGVECDVTCGDFCCNRTISKGFPDDLLQFISSDVYGFAVGARKDIPRGTGIIEYVGSVHAGQLGENDRFAYPINRVGIDLPMYISSRVAGNESRMIPNSNRPNCIIQPWVVGRQIRLKVVATDDIQKSEVLGIRYPNLM